MSTIPIGRPRRIDASLVEIGDDISVEHEAERGLTPSVRGIVAKKVILNNVRHYMTKEGATIMSWTPNAVSKVKVTLYGRDAKPMETLFDDMDIVRKRIA